MQFVSGHLTRFQMLLFRCSFRLPSLDLLYILQSEFLQLSQWQNTNNTCSTSGTTARQLPPCGHTTLSHLFSSRGRGNQTASPWPLSALQANFLIKGLIIPAARNFAGCYAPTHLSRFLLKLLDGSLVDAPTFVDEVAGGGGLARIDVADDDDVDVGLLLSHFGC